MIELRKYKCMHVHTQCISRARDLVSVHAYIRPSQSGGRGGRVYEIKIAPEEGGYSRGAYNQASTVHVPCTMYCTCTYIVLCQPHGVAALCEDLATRV